MTLIINIILIIIHLILNIYSQYFIIIVILKPLISLSFSTVKQLLSSHHFILTVIMQSLRYAIINIIIIPIFIITGITFTFNVIITLQVAVRAIFKNVFNNNSSNCEKIVLSLHFTKISQNHVPTCFRLSLHDSGRRLG